KVLSFKDEPDFEVPGEWNNPGHQTWFEDAHHCLAYWQESTPGYNICLAVCPRAKNNKTMIHDIAKVASAKTPFFNGFFSSVDIVFRYEKQKDAQR
ncbi:MAG: hypothetical protein JSW07_15165, partial [bacterium]